MQNKSSTMFSMVEKAGNQNGGLAVAQRTDDAGQQIIEERTRHTDKVISR